MISVQRVVLIGLLTLGSAWGSTISPVSGSLTLTGVVDSSLNFLGLDIRGTAGFLVDSNPVILTDSFASPNFGNLTLVAENVPFDGSGVAVTFNPATLTIVPGPGVALWGIGATTAGTPSNGDAAFLSPVNYYFQFTQSVPYGNNTYLDTFTLSQAVLTPEPWSFALVALGLAMLAVWRKLRFA